MKNIVTAQGLQRKSSINHPYKASIVKTNGQQLFLSFAKLRCLKYQQTATLTR